MAIEYRLSYTASDINKKLEKVDTLSTKIETKQDKLTFDSTPTANSDNPVTSNGIHAALNTKQPVGDYALSSDIPNVPNWALQTKKPIYTAAEVGAATESYVDTKISSMVDSAPETLDTLNKLSAALGDDSNFAATVAEQIGNKVDKVDGMALSSNDFTDEEKAKLASIAEGANNYVLPVANLSAIGGVKSGTDITVDSDGNVSVNDDSHNHVISNIDGLQDVLDNKQPVGDYALSSDVPLIYAWAKAENPPTYTASDVGALPDTTVIPTKVSDLTNDSGFITSYTETDPTVPAWAKEESKPTYTADEIGAVSYNEQTLTDEQKTQARANIGAADQTALDEVSALVGDTAVSEQIDNAIAEIPQVDWNQNDESAADYVKNRTHYEIPEVWLQVEFVENDKSGVTTAKLGSTSYIWENDKTYIVRVDGMEYTFDGMASKDSVNAFENKTIYYIGAEYIMLNSNMDFSTYPFCFLTADFTNIYAVFEDGTSNHTVEIFESEAKIHQLDPKYIKDMYYVEENIIDITGLEYVIEVKSSITTYSISIPLELGQAWNVWHNSSGSSEASLRYENLEVQVDTDGELYIGDLNTSSIPFYIKGTDLVFSSSFMSGIRPTIFKIVGVSGTITSEPIVHQLDQKYIPNANWNQSDPNGDGYIANRTHYEEENILAEMYNEVTDGYAWRMTPFTYEDKEYTILCDGVEYTLGWGTTYYAGSDAIYFGSPPQAITDDVPFSIYIFGSQTPPKTGEAVVTFLDNTVEHTLQIIGEPIVHQLDPKYIKDMYYETEPVETELVPETTLDCTSTTQVNNPFTIDLVGGQTYLVTWNGVKYECVAQIEESLGFTYIGDTSILGGDDSGEPFLCASMDGDVVLVVAENGTYTISISAIVMPVIHQIDPKYIKDMYYEEVIKTDITGASYTINGFNTSNLTVSHDPIPLKLGQIWEESHKHYSGNWTGSANYEVQQTDDGVLYLGAPIDAQNSAHFYLTTDELSISSAIVDAGYGTFKFTCISGVTDESIIHQIDPKYIPDSVKGMLVTVSEDAEGNLVASNNSEEIIAAYEAGVCVRLELDGLVHDLTMDMGGTPIFLSTIPNSKTTIVMSMIVVNADYTVNIEEAIYNIPTPSAAQVGQVLSVKAVDASGKPTEWEAVDMVGGESVELDTTLTVEGKAADAKAVGDAISTVSALVGDTAVSEQIENAIADAGFVVSPFVATVGQTIVVKAVDANGRPTEWEATDLPSGDEWELMATVDMVQDANYAQIDLPWEAKKLFVYCPSSGTAAGKSSGTYCLATGQNGYNHQKLVTSLNQSMTGTWTDVLWICDLTFPKPMGESQVGTGRSRNYQSAYTGNMRPTTLYITSHDGALSFNAKTWYVYGIRA